MNNHQVLTMTSAEALNQAIREMWRDGEYNSAITGVVFYPIMWVVSWWIGRKITKEASRLAADSVPSGNDEHLAPPDNPKP